MSGNVNFHVVRSALQNQRVYAVFIFADQVFYRSYVLRHIRLRFFAVLMSIFSFDLRLRASSPVWGYREK